MMRDTITKQNKIKVVVDFYKDGKNWDANCQEVGLVGYQGRDLPTVKKLALDGLQLYFNDKSFTLIESVSEIEVKK